MKKKTIISLIHLNFTGGFGYAFFKFISTPRLNILARRLWAYECWLIFGFYAIFLFLLLREKTKNDQVITFSLAKGKLRLSRSKVKNS